MIYYQKSAGTGRERERYANDNPQGSIVGGVLLSLMLISRYRHRVISPCAVNWNRQSKASQNQLKIVSLNQTALPNIFEVELNTGEVLYSDLR